jgi:5-(carboxyamino)imidazole ribonucleotide synthase
MKIGIIGGGQLGQMLALAGIPLGLQFCVLDPTPDSPAGQVVDQIVGNYDDERALDELAAKSDVITYEFENVPVTSARYLTRKRPVYPDPTALEKAQDRLVEKSFFQVLGLPTSPFARVDSLDDLTSAIERIHLPAVLKTRRLGYDGKGQIVIHTNADIQTAWKALGGQPLILEGFVKFDRELSILAARALDGSTTFYPLIENHHHAGILRLSKAPVHSTQTGILPSGSTIQLQTLAEAYAVRALDSLKYVGLLAIELFQSGDKLLINEMAPRVHNSGHWTIEGAVTSQFENHLRAIAALPLGPASARCHAAMINLIGTVPETASVLAIPNTYLHLYGKEPRPGRKLGHITVTANSRSSTTDIQILISAVQSLLSDSPV